MMRRTLFKHTTSLVSNLSIPRISPLISNHFSFAKYVYDFEEGNAGMKF
jgi:pyruvate,orthophosphate dikinase